LKVHHHISVIKILSTIKYKNDNNDYFGGRRKNLEVNNSIVEEYYGSSNNYCRW